MLRHAKAFISLLLPVVPIVLFPACSGGSSDVATTSPPVAGAAGTHNNAPVVYGTSDSHARVGQPFQLQPQATDADGDPLRFTAENLPPWASIDPSSGRVSGTPGELDVGVYESIQILVADGNRTTRSAPFAIIVMSEPGTGFAALQWELPAAKVDGSPLDDLAGYRIMYGRHANDLDRSVLIDDPAVTSYEFTTLEPGVWYFAVVAVNSSGLEGPPTITASKSI